MSRMKLEVLTETEIEAIHSRTLGVLEDPGVRVNHAPILKALAKVGAKVDDAAGRVRFPPELVEELRREAPPSARLTGLNGRVLDVGGENRYYSSLITDPFIIDYEKGPRRPVLEDIRRHAIVGESLDRVDAMMRMQYPAEDVPEPRSCLKTMEVFLCHCTKHAPIYPSSAENAREWIGAGEILAGSEGLRKTPLMSMAVAVTSPLTLHEANGDLLGMALEYNMPVISTVCPMAGATSPYTVAGTMVAANAEALMPVVIAQALKPGHPVFYAIGPSVADLRTGRDLYYKAEKALFKIMATQMGKFYHLPIAGEAGGTMTWRYDPQNGAEGTLYLLAAIAGGQNLMGGLGSCHNANGMSAEQIVIQCGLVDQAEYVARGVSLSDEELAVESIRGAGPGGDFFADDLTLRFMRESPFFDTPHFDLSGGYGDSVGVVARAHETVETLVANYKPTVPESIRQDLQAYFRELV
ncbi:MAG TPA: trimethylamine methyltransferase family protein [Sumerlaeia bacterium]|nr:trimethylamine methyltransferase family protein [Sumerlaeia bacterium]